jgi:N12 class adenine-specific DNA methylase/predicted RNA methylase/superfamily II DNA/RNA helicase
MLILFVKSQLALFDMPVHVAGSVRKDGTVVAPHMSTRKVAIKPAAQGDLFSAAEKPAKKPRRTKLDTFIEKHGGVARMASLLADMTEGQRDRLYEAMAKVGDKSPADVKAMFADVKPAEHVASAEPDLFSAPAEPEAKPEPVAEKPVEPAPEQKPAKAKRERKAKPKAVAEPVEQPAAAEPEKLLTGADGAPLVVYHGTHTDFDTFDRKASVTKYRRQEGLDAIGSWFTSDAEQATHYGKNIIAANLVLRNPRVFNTFQDMRDEWDDWNGSRGIPKEAKARHKKNTFWGDADGFVEALKRQGYDGIEIKPHSGEGSIEFKDRNTYIVFDGDQVKRLPAAAADAPPTEPVERGPFGVPAGITKGERRAINAKVVELVTSGQTEFSDADKALMRQYSGNGGCGDSLNEFYTDPDVAAAMWTAIRSFGFQGGSVLEPSCATGVFMHTAPADAKVTGVELDPISSKVAQVLHGDRHEITNASLERFATGDGDRQFDLVIGNCPFGLRGSLIKDDKPDLKTAEAYFMDTALDKAKPGGLVAMIVPTGVMDAKSNRSVRERLLRKGEFLGAARMPNTAFEHSHTEVTTDVLFFRKRDDDAAGALMTVDQDTLKKLGVWDDEYLAGGYFEGRGAPNIYGTMEAGWRAKAGMGQDITVSGSMSGVPAELAKWTPDEFKTATPDVVAVVDALGDDDAAKKKALGGAMKRAYDNAKNGDTKVVDGVTYILQGNPPRWHRIDEFLQDAAVTDAQSIAADINRLMSDTGRVVDREAVESAVRAYVAKHGVPSKNTNLQVAASQDRTLYRLIGAVNPDGSLSDVVTGRANRRVEGTLDTAAQSLAVEHDTGTFSVDELADRSGKDAETVEDTLFASPAYAYAGDGQWTTMDQYLTGDLWSKLDRVREEMRRGDLREGVADKYALQAKQLEEAIDPKSLEDVEIQVNSAFVPTDILTAYFNETKNASDNKWTRDQPDIRITFDGGLYKIENQGYQHGVLEKYLNRTGARKDDMPTINAWNEGFKNWLLSSRYRDEVEDLYNRKFRGFRQQEFSDATIDIPGMVTDGLKQYQYSGLRWALAAGKGIIAADVGLGKTVRGLMLAKMAKMNGTAKKPTFIVPKSVLANWVAETDKWFPGSRVLVIGETYTRDKDGTLKAKVDSAAERNRKLHELTQNDYDFVFISQPAFNDIDVDPITKGQYVNDDFWVQRGDKLGNAGDKRLKAIREAHDQAVASRDFQKRTDAIYFNELGIDMMLVDEGHAFKNLYAARARFGESPKFLGGSGLSNRALDMNLKTRWLREQNAGKGIFMLTATPTKNSPLEIYSMLSHIAPEAFERIGVRNSEEFLDRFCEFTNDKILGTDGAIEDALVTTGFKNLDELRDIMKRFIDRKTAADVGLVLPKRNDHMHMIDMTDEQKAVYGDLREQMQEATGKDSTGDAHIFSIMDKMAKAAMDLELLDPKAYAGAKSPKYEIAAKNIAAGAKDGGQVVFAENVAAHEKIAAELVKQGIPRDQIAIMNAAVASSSAQRQTIADKFNAGKIKVVIGNKVMEEGINLQKATTDIHHLDLPWEPASMQQRNGRGLRQGNVNEAVRIHTYLTKGSFDGYRYQSMMAKKDWQDVLWSGGDRIDNMAREGRFDRADLMIMMSADPEAERAKYEADKAAATERFNGEQRRAAASEFVRFQVLKRSYGELQNKRTTSAERLRAKIETAKTKLANNKYFTARAALDSDQPVVIQPDSGMVLQAGVGLDIAEKDGTRQKWVVSGVNAATGDITIRRYADGGRRTVPAHQLKDGVELFAYKQDEENEAIAKRLADQANEKAGSAATMKAVKDLPHGVINANYAAFQDRLKDGLRNHNWSHEGDSVGLLDAAGDVKAVRSYEARGHLSTHDLMLPTPEHRAKAIEAYVADHAAKTYREEYLQKRRGGRSEGRTVEKFPGAYDQRTNQWATIGKHLYGDDFEKQAHDVFERRQLEKVRRAPTFTDALRAAAPTTKLNGYSQVAEWPRKTIAMLYAKAKHDGDLDKPWKEVAPKNQYGSAEIPAAVTNVRNGSQIESAVGNWTGAPITVRSALAKLAKHNGHSDLTSAMIVGSHDESNPGETVKRLMELPMTDRHVNAALGHVLAKHPELADKKPADVGVHYLPSVPYGLQSEGLAAIHKHYKGAE